jgi:hypothetical protein
MSSHENKPPEGETLLGSMAESIGSTLGKIAAKANALPEALLHNNFLQTVEGGAKRLLPKSKTAGRKITKSASKRAKSSKLVKATRRDVRKASTHAKRAVRPGKKRAARKARRKK